MGKSNGASWRRTLKLSERKNYNLCSLNLNFKEKPYCNQQKGLFDNNSRFCDVCKRSWNFKNNMIIESTVKEYKLSDLTPGSQWILYEKQVEVIETILCAEYPDYSDVKLMTYDRKEVVYPLKWINSIIKPLISIGDWK